MWRRLSSVFAPGSYTSSDHHSVTSRSASPRPFRKNTTQTLPELPIADSPITTISEHMPPKGVRQPREKAWIGSRDSGKRSDKDGKERDVRKDSKDKDRDRKEKDRARDQDEPGPATSSRDKPKSKSETIRVLTAEKLTLSTQLAQLQAQVRTFEERDGITQSQYRALEEEVQTLRRKAAQDDEEIQSLLSNGTRATEAAAKHIQDLESRTQGLEEQLRRAKEKLQRAEVRQANGVVARPDHGAHAEEVFKSKADSYAGAEIIRMVETLNSEILQCAAFVAEAIMAADSKSKEEDRVIEKCRRRTADRVGARLMEAMKRNVETGEKDPLPLQLALQHTLLVWSCYIVQAFTPENKELNGQLSGIWSKIAMREEPAVAGKWRAIMASQLRGPTTMYRAIYDDCRYIMVAGGWSSRASHSATLSANVQARLMAVESSIMKLKEAVIEGVTSTEVVPCICNVGQAYDPDQMDSAYPDHTDQDFVQKPIVCTTDLGVKKLVATRLRDGSLAKNYELILKPKVILPSALDDGTVL
ncbi:hypothetical protein D9611_003552 [Ephemerocybe angulata]|uniref:Uncharacterized protein n=1 Tax=Ephemerocybe angulata TaxID=980116 RepID=A0A8H5EY47_9AGAR|nr:hypothetical protein D9611_003552 [Tulosesus angulatus]